MGLFDRVQQHREEKNEPKPERVFRDEKPSAGMKKFIKNAHKRNKWGSDAEEHFKKINIARKLKK